MGQFRSDVRNRSLGAALRTARQENRIAVIADLKFRSPRDGELLASRDLDGYLAALVRGGVDALSTVTDTATFGGSMDLARRIRGRTRLPLLRKDYFRSPDQVDESRAAGFDAVHLTLRTIGDLGLVAALQRRAEELGLAVVLGVHTAAELHQALALGGQIVGINNRDIGALELDDGTVAHTETLAPLVPRGVLVVSESGLTAAGDVARAHRAGADAVLVGTALARSPDVAATVRCFRTAHLQGAVR